MQSSFFRKLLEIVLAVCLVLYMHGYIYISRLPVEKWIQKKPSKVSICFIDKTGCEVQLSLESSSMIKFFDLLSSHKSVYLGSLNKSVFLGIVTIQFQDGAEISLNIFNKYEVEYKNRLYITDIVWQDFFLSM